METVLVALVTAVPPTIVALGAWRSSAAGRKRVESIDRAVNGRPEGELTLVSKVDGLVAGMGDVKAHLRSVDGWLVNLERKVG